MPADPRAAANARFVSFDAAKAPPMNLSWLEDFLALAATGNFSRAAEDRHMTQPAFSRRVRALEEELYRLASFPLLHPEPMMELGPGGELHYANPAAHTAFPDLMVRGASGNQKVKIWSSAMGSSVASTPSTCSSAFTSDPK